MKIYLSTDQAKYYDTPAVMKHMTSYERGIKAVKKFGFFFALAIASIFVPVLHFFLVPLFLFLSFLMAYKEYGVKYRLDLTESRDCLYCQKLLSQEYLIRDDFDFKCQSCGSNYIIIV